MSLVDLAAKRAKSHTPQSKADEEMWRWRVCVQESVHFDPVLALHNALRQAKVSLNVQFFEEPLGQIGRHHLLTGVVTINETYLARGVGIDKQTTKLDTYGKAFNVLLNEDVKMEELNEQEDIGAAVLFKEMSAMHKEDPRGFVERVESSAQRARQRMHQEKMRMHQEKQLEHDSFPPELPPHMHDPWGFYGPPPFHPPWEGPRPPPPPHHMGFRARGDLPPGPPPPGFPGPRLEGKRPRFPGAMPEAKRPKFENKNAEGGRFYSLSPKTPPMPLLKYREPFPGKLKLLKKLLKEEGITRAHIVPKMDFFAYKCAINVNNVFKHCEVKGRPSLYMEIYFDEMLIQTGPQKWVREQAQLEAYQQLAVRISQADQFARMIAPENHRPEVPRMYFMAMMERNPEVESIISKGFGEDMEARWTSNHKHMQQSMNSGPDLSLSQEKIIFIDEASDNKEPYNDLDVSATRSLMLLECETRRVNGRFNSNMTLQGRELASSADMPSPKEAKRICCEKAIEKLGKRIDHICMDNEIKGTIWTTQELLNEAKHMKEAGIEPAQHFEPSTEDMPRAGVLGQIHKKRQSSMEKNEDLPENQEAKDLMGWIARAFYKIIDEYLAKISVEDLVLDTSNMGWNVYKTLMGCCHRMGLRVFNPIGKPAYSDDTRVVIRLALSSQYLAMVLQLNSGRSGRFSFKSLINHAPSEKLDALKKCFHECHQELKDQRTVPKIPGQGAPRFGWNLHKKMESLAAAQEAAKNE